MVFRYFRLADARL